MISTSLTEEAPLPTTLARVTDLPRTLRTAVLVAPREWRIEERALPEPGPGEVLLQLEGCGVCGSNLPLWQGQPWFTYPVEAGAPGHEGWGRIAALGEGVEGWDIGTRVASLGTHAFATYDVVPADQLVRLPDALEGQPLPGEPLGCALNVFRRSQVGASDTVVILGAGFLGNLLVSLCTRAGARVAAVGRREDALAFARHYGAEHTAQLGESPEALQRELVEWAGADGISVVIEATGAAAPLELAGQLLRTRGRLVIAGFHQDGPRTIDLRAWNWLGLDVINAHERDPRIYLDGIQRAVELQALDLLDPRPLYTHHFPLERIQEAFEHLERRPQGFLKALIDLQS